MREIWIEKKMGEGIADKSLIKLTKGGNDGHTQELQGMCMHFLFLN